MHQPRRGRVDRGREDGTRAGRRAGEPDPPTSQPRPATAYGPARVRDPARPVDPRSAHPVQAGDASRVKPIDSGRQSADQGFDIRAEPEPRYGRRGREHALSPNPGTPPVGNLAVGYPSAMRAGAPSRASRGAADLSGLAHLAEVLRVEIEIEPGGCWRHGLCEWASTRGLEVKLRSIHCSLAGRRVRILVALSGLAPEPFRARVLSVGPPPQAGGAVQAQLAIFGSQPGELVRWEKLVKRVREI